MTRLERALGFASAAFAAGVTLNWLAVLIYGAMPEYYPEIADGVALGGRHVSGFSIIGDYIPLPGGWQVSPGDLLTYAGLLAVAVLAVAYVLSGGMNRRLHRGETSCA